MSMCADASSDAAPLRVLIIDDEKNIRATLRTCLGTMQCEVTETPSADAAQAALERSAFDLAFLDLRLGSDNGLDVLPNLLAIRPQLAVVVFTAYATIDTAVEAMKRGATHYLPKPFTPSQIRALVQQIARQRSLSQRLDELEGVVGREVPRAELQTRSAGMQSVLDVITRAADADAPVLLCGESGTGKTVLAQSLHLQSSRRSKPFVTVNCPTLSEELLASELFGHARGAFTGAVRDQQGRVETAEGGTLFLDEVAEITPPLQAKLLRFLQEHNFERVGENRTRHADVRMVAATNRNLRDEVQAGRFREDLLFRLNVIEIRVPALRQRSEDILPLAEHFLAFFSRSAGKPVPSLSEAAQGALAGYGWPGNVRELRNVIERAMILWPGQTLTPAAFPEQVADGSNTRPQIGGPFRVEDVEREHILRVLQHATTHEEAAKVLGIDVTTLWRKRKKYLES